MTDSGYRVSVATPHAPRQPCELAGCHARLAAVQALFDELDMRFETVEERIRKPGKKEYHGPQLGSVDYFAENYYAVYVAVPALTFLTAFAKSFGKRLGDQSANALGKAFSDWITRLHKSDISDSYGIVIHDGGKKLDIILPAQLPADAFEQLLDKVASWQVEEKAQSNAKLRRLRYRRILWLPGRWV